MEHLIWLGSLCASGIPLRGGLLLGLFAAGAAGSVMHCAPMCSGFVLGQVSSRMARLPAAQLCEWRRLHAGLLLPYHAGRLVTYAGLGALAAGSAAALQHAAWVSALSAACLALAAMLFLLHALRCLVPRAGRVVAWADRAPPGWGRLLARITSRLPRGGPGGEFLLGLALGFMPCGFLYAALLAAIATRRPAEGAAAMLAFGLGTVPALAVAGIAGQAAGRRWRISAAAPALMAANAAMLLLAAGQILARATME